MISRRLKNQLQTRLENEPRRFIQVIYGPRQVGKTTLVNQIMRESSLPVQYVSADAIASPQSIWLSQQWDNARLKARTYDKGSLLIIDEIQKIENWSELVKKEWDYDSQNGTNVKLVVLGSSRLLLQQGLTESLMGRFETNYMGHWSYSEMKEAFGISPEEYVWFGGYPGAIGLRDDEQRWKSYIADSLIESSISKDILMLTRVDKPALMKRLFELGCTYSGQILSYNKMLGQLQDAGNATTLAHYLELTSSAGLLSGLEKFTPEKVRKRASSPKYQVHNTALMTASSSTTFEEIQTQPDKWGRWVESAVGTHIIEAVHQHPMEAYYWRDRNDEVDFVLTYGNKTIALEVKSGRMKNPQGMEAFKKKYNPDKMYLIGRDGISWQEFLQISPIELF